MRRTTLSAAGLAAAALAFPTTAAAVPTQYVKFSAKPAKISTAKRKVPIRLNVTVGTRETEAGKQPPTTKTADVYFPAGSVWNGALFPKCAPSVISAAKSTADCPAGSIIGTGKAIGIAQAGVIRQDDITITAVNGGANQTSLFVEGARPLRIGANLDAKLTKVSGKFGIKLSVDLPQALQEPAPGVLVSIDTFNVEVFAKRKIKGVTRGLLEITKCPGEWYGSGTFTFRDDSQLSASASQKCSK